MIEKLEKNNIYLECLEKEFNEVFTKENFNSDIENNDFTNYYIYLIDNIPVGLINYYLMYERAELININVNTNYQNQKIGSKLIEFMLEDCKIKDVKSITLEVKKTNVNAIHLYKKYGFNEIGIRKEYYQGIDGILMEKELM